MRAENTELSVSSSGSEAVKTTLNIITTKEYTIIVFYRKYMYIYLYGQLILITRHVQPYGEDALFLADVLPFGLQSSSPWQSGS